MFFSTELLSRRDSGYGLLWLAATLGSKTKKLPRRNVLTADIHQLCGLISDPPEPLALRLSSNLMVGVVRVYKLKHEIFHTEVTSCFTSLKKTLREFHSMGDLDMAQPDGIRNDALDIVAEPGMAMLTEFDANDMDWDIVFRKADSITGRDEFNPDPPAPSSSFATTNRKLYQLEESFDHLFSASFLNNRFGEAEGDGNEPSSSANDVLFDLDFGGDPDVGLGEEMERELQEAWNLNSKRSEDEAATTAAVNGSKGIAMGVDPAFGGDAGTEMYFEDAAFDGVFDQNQAPNEECAIDNPGRDEENNAWGFPEVNAIRIPPPYDKTPPRSCLSRRTSDVQQGGGVVDEAQSQRRHKEALGSKKSRKKVTLIDPRTELTDQQLKFQRDNYANEMKRLVRQAQKKKERKEGKRRFEELLWAPPKDFVAPELIEWYNSRVVYPVKARETAWRTEVEELQNPRKRRRLEKDFHEVDQEPTHDVQNPDDDEIQDFAIEPNLDHMGVFDGGRVIDAAENLGQLEDPPSGSRRSSDSPGQPRRGNSRPASPLRSLLANSSNLDKNDLASNSLFPWDRTGPSSSNVHLPESASFGWASDLGTSIDSGIVRIRRSLKAESINGRPSNFEETGGQPFDDGENGINAEIPGLGIETVELEDANLTETQESQSMVALEKNTFNFLGYAKMHVVSSSKTLFFSDLVPVDSSSARVAAEGFYHCLALATKGLIRLEQDEAYGPIRIHMK